MQQLASALVVGLLFCALCYFFYSQLDKLQTKVTQLELQMMAPLPDESRESVVTSAVEELFYATGGELDDEELAEEEVAGKEL